MSLIDDMQADVSLVFLDDFAGSFRVERDGVGRGDVRCVLSAGVERFINERYIKNTWEVTANSQDGLKKGDVLKRINSSDQVVETYELNDVVVREGDVQIFSAEKV